ncbi:MAG TPA: NAD(P)-binding domain-containing protein [Sphingobium sp.]|uniref:NADPH-dependent F420 reductase n=1 Tax=Sphingobium sp. TaxID=1912891 RepID=UPI002ED1BEAC
MTYAIIGSGAIGTALARQFARKAVPVFVANSRGPASVVPLAEELGPSIQPVDLAIALAADIVILAVPFAAVADAVASVTNWSGRIVIDATNAINFADFSPAELGGRPSSDIIADLLPGARLVKAFNTLPAAVLASVPDGEGGHRTVFVSSNDPEAAGTFAALAEKLGYAPINLGRIDEGGRLAQFGGPLTVHSLMKED